MQRVLLLSALFLTGEASAQEDDDLPALPSAKPRHPGRPKPKRRPPSKTLRPPANEELAPLPAATGELLVRLPSSISGARLFIDGADSGSLPQPAQRVSAGEHDIEVRRPGYASFRKTMMISGDELNEVNVAMEPLTAVLTVSSDRDGADIYINGKLAGTAPLLGVEVGPGEVEIIVKKDGYGDGTREVTVMAGVDYPVEVKLGPPVASEGPSDSDLPTDTRLTPNSARASLPPEPGAEAETSVAIYKRWWFWGAIAAVVAVGIAVATTVVVSGPHGSRELDRDQWPCYSASPMTCPAGNHWINLPSGIVPFGD